MAKTTTALLVAAVLLVPGLVGAKPSQKSPKDKIPPKINIGNPRNLTYTTNDIYINLSLNEKGYCFYGINGNNKTLLVNSNLTFMGTELGLNNGIYVLNVYCQDAFGNKNHTRSISFKVDAPISAPVVSGGGGGGGGYYAPIATNKTIDASKNQTTNSFMKSNGLDDNNNPQTVFNGIPLNEEVIQELESKVKSDKKFSLSKVVILLLLAGGLILFLSLPSYLYLIRKSRFERIKEVLGSMAKHKSLNW